MNNESATVAEGRRVQIGIDRLLPPLGMTHLRGVTDARSGASLPLMQRLGLLERRT